MCACGGIFDEKLVCKKHNFNGKKNLPKLIELCPKKLREKYTEFFRTAFEILF
jgi:hypothetical protein